MSKEERKPMIIEGDCIEIMKEFDKNTFDAIVTDPPYGLEFMGKKWDKLWDMRGIAENKEDYIRTDGVRQQNNPISYNRNQPQYKAGLQAQKWHTQWLTEAYRVLKPGASMLVMGGTRTFHRLMVAIEDTGFTIKDTLMWIYGSGFPKCQDLGKMIDKKARRQYVGVAIELGLFVPENSKWDWTKGEHGISNKWWEKFKSFLSPEDWQKIEREIIGSGTSGKTAIWNEKGEMGDFDITAPSTDLAKHWDGFKIGGIKPAYEPIVWAVKPPEGSYIDNVLKWGVGAVNVDECRVGTETRINKGMSAKQPDCAGTFRDDNWVPRDVENIAKGRFPANVILDEEAGRMLDEQSGDNVARGGKSKGRQANNSRFFGKTEFGNNDATYNDSGGASRFFYCAKASRGERNRGLDGMEEKDAGVGDHRVSGDFNERLHDRSKVRTANNHPTVKPIKLFEYLIKLVTRRGQIIIDPFLGSGTTMVAANNVGRECVGIEREGEYIPIAEKRIEYWLKEKGKGDGK